MNTLVDTHVMSFLESKLAPMKFKRIDGSIDDSILDKSREKSLLDADGKTVAGKLADFVRQHIKQPNLKVEAKSLTNDELPCFIVVDEEGRRLRDFMKATNQGGNIPLGEFDKKTLVVNTNNNLISSLPKLHGKNPELAKKVLNEIYDLALLSQKEMDPKDLNQFIKRSFDVLGALIS